MDKKIVGERLKILREGIHLSQAKLAEKFGEVDQPSIFRYENGLNFPPYHILMQYADFFDVSLDYIFGRILTIITINNTFRKATLSLG